MNHVGLSLLIVCSFFPGAYCQEKALVEFQADPESAAYLMKLGDPGIPFLLNMGDEIQYQFVLSRLDFQDITEESNPQLFFELQKLRDHHTQAEYGPGRLPEELMYAPVRGDREEVHEILGLHSSDGEPHVLEAHSSLPDGAWFSFVDVSLHDEDGMRLEKPGAIDLYDEGETVLARATVLLPAGELPEFTAVSLKIEDSLAFGFRASLVVLPYIVPTSDQAPGLADQLNITQPQRADQRLDIPFKVCLNRAGSDCSVYYPDSTWRMRIPLAGSITFDNPIDMDQYENNPRSRDARIYFVLLTRNYNGGGGCPPVNGVGTPILQNFFDPQYVTISADHKTFSWSLDPADFGGDCQLVRDRASLSMMIRLPIKYAAYSRPSHILINSQGPRKNVPVMEVTNSCFAKGTLIQMVDGSHKKIEAISFGDSVACPHGDGGLTVVDVISGKEPIPMVRLLDEDQRSILVTEGHPLINGKREVVLAKYLQQGEEVQTIAGPKKLIKVSREMHQGDVYNLKLGLAWELNLLKQDQTNMYADGFLVGDSRVQGKYGKEDRLKKRDLLKTLPVKWHRDYHLKAARQAAGVAK